MNGGRLLTLIQHDFEDTILAKSELLASFRDRDYRRQFVAERVRSSMALQIRALREQREMSQTKLGDAIGMAQTWVSKLENPDYGKMTVATLLRLSDAFDTDLEIKFRPFSTTIDTLPRQGKEYFTVPSFSDEFSLEELTKEEEARMLDRQSRPGPYRVLGGSALDGLRGQQGDSLSRIGAASAGFLRQYAAS